MTSKWPIRITILVAFISCHSTLAPEDPPPEDLQRSGLWQRWLNLTLVEERCPADSCWRASRTPYHWLDIYLADPDGSFYSWDMIHIHEMIGPITVKVSMPNRNVVVWIRPVDVLARVGDWARLRSVWVEPEVPAMP